MYVYDLYHSHVSSKQRMCGVCHCRGRPLLSNRQIYESVVYQLAEWWHTQLSRLGFPCPFHMTIQVRIVYVGVLSGKGKSS